MLRRACRQEHSNDDSRQEDVRCGMSGLVLMTAKNPSNALKEREIVRFPSIRSKSGRASNSESDGQSSERTRHRSKKSQRNQMGIEKKEFWWGPKSQYQKSLEN